MQFIPNRSTNQILKSQFPANVNSFIVINDQNSVVESISIVLGTRLFWRLPGEYVVASLSRLRYSLSKPECAAGDILMKQRVQAFLLEDICYCRHDGDEKYTEKPVDLRYLQYHEN